MSADAEARLLDALVEATLVALPPGLVPTRGFMSAVLETTVALTDAWLTAYVAAAGGSYSVTSAALQRQLNEMVGKECSKAWWNDATERGVSDTMPSKPPSSHGSSVSTTPTPPCSVDLDRRHSRTRRELQRHVLSARSGASSPPAEPEPGTLAVFERPSTNATLEAFTSLMKRSVSCVIGERCEAEGKDGLGVPSTVWIRFGAAWALCGLEDILGSVAAHILKKADASAKRRPAQRQPRSPKGKAKGREMADGSKPDLPGSPSSAARPSSSSGSKGSRPGTSGGRVPPADKAEPARMKMRLLTWKNIVGAVREDTALRACRVLEVALVEVATGSVPYIDVDDLMSVTAYRGLLVRWADQEAGTGEGTTERAGRALAQAMEGPQPAPLRSAPPAAQVQAEASPRPASGKSGASKPPPAPQGRGGWLPREFVLEFNEEGEEVGELGDGQGAFEADVLVL